MEQSQTVEDDFTNPSCSSTVDDCRINCTNTESLRKILEITEKHITEFADSSYFKGQNSEFITKFSEVFKNALQENIVVNGLPWVLDERKLTLLEKEDHKQMIDDAVLAHLSKVVSNVAYKRKRCPQQCCRILNMKVKHELQNLKKTKVLDTSPIASFSPKDSNESKKKFSEFCNNFNSVKKTVQKEFTELQEIVKEINVAHSIHTRQRTALKSICTDDTETLNSG